ncbi:NUDIX domain-containing protein [Sporomusa acidovorans]|uniref:Nudix hydrolase domain-containing protein n=1 Tax=Sporomusa acidovorans (strain ATCC 49682 / DSM 3132 / Mol) TaxID=1123286 RepID=A0ABZ3J2F8_SPOA4|nr:NUDIX domain-containing protein [Sporomusa acidovorans]OZC14802.1 NUDIX domain protein [Sporomusa acidovorans DSM 3132]SDF86614.1 Predicted NTP pyrophosphohydrolase, NUDIX family [Sporomusa acidovorans]
MIFLEDNLSAGLLMYRLHNGCLELLLAHPGGPYFVDKDDRYWGIPKGHLESGETILEGAVREFVEETGIDPNITYSFYLGSAPGKYKRIVHVWAFEGDWDMSKPAKSNLFQLEWPPSSGQVCLFPEIDKVGFFSIVEAKKKIEHEQLIFVSRLEKRLIEENYLLYSYD